MLVTGRQEGKTTALLAWLRAAPPGEHRIFVAHSALEAMRVYRSTWDEEDNPTDLESWQFVGLEEATRDAWGAVLACRGGVVVLGIDNLDLVLQRLVGWPVGALTMTAVPMEVPA